jgi:hypothetical protein
MAVFNGKRYLFWAQHRYVDVLAPTQISAISNWQLADSQTNPGGEL